MKLAVITSGFLPIPATKGGAVENLVVNLLNENEINKKIKFNIFSIYDEDAIKESKNYKETNFIFFKINIIIKFLDKIMFFIAKNILKKENSHSYRYIFQRLSFLNKVSKNLKKNNYDKVLLENHPTQFLALKWRKNYIKYKDKYYYHCHNEFPGKYGCEDIIKSTKKIICVSEFRKNNVMQYMKMNNEKYCVLKNGISINKVDKKSVKKEIYELKSKYNIKDNEKIIMYTGRIVPGKGVKELIKAFKNIEDKNIKLLIVGASLNSLNIKNKYEEEVYNLVTDDIKDKIIFTGFIKYDEMYKYYYMADIIVIPSVMEDSAPLTVIETLMYGKPLITTNSGGIPEYAINESAVIIERNERIVENLTNEIENLVNDREKQEKITQVAIEESKDLTTEKFYENFCDILMK